MIEIIIFSFNRALQLDTLLTSLFEKWKEPVCTIDVLYNTTDSSFEQGYDLLKNKYTNVNFHKESEFGDSYSVKEWLNIFNLKEFILRPVLRKPKTDFRSRLLSIIEHTNSPFVMFLTDDSMFINDTTISEKVFDWLNLDPFQHQFSLRLGLGMNNSGGNISKNNKTIRWNFYSSRPDSNWGYNFSVDGHIYSKEIVLKLFKKYIFIHPNSLEGYINAQVRRHHWLSEGMAGLAPSILSYPINMVQQFIKNESLGVDCKMMNEWLLAGYTLKYPVPDVIDTFQQYPDYLYLYKNEEQLIKKIK